MTFIFALKECSNNFKKLLENLCGEFLIKFQDYNKKFH